MKGLFIKDLKLLKKRGIFILVLIAGYMVFYLGTVSMELAVGFATLMISVFSLTTFTYDEYENGMPFLFTLPIRRIDYVREKYMLGFLMATVTWIVAVTECFLFDSFIWTDRAGDFGDRLTVCVVYLVAVYFIIALYIALKLRFVERSLIVITIVSTMIFVFWTVVFIEFEYGVSFLELGFNWNFVGIAAVIVLFTLTVILYWWSVRIMEMREL